MKLYAFHCGGEKLNRAIIDAFDPNPAERIYFPYFCYLMQHNGENILFDTGAHPDLITDPITRLGPAAAAYEILMAPGDDVVSCLATVGIKPEDVRHVIQSHLHYDHAGGLEFFPHSTIYVSKREREFAANPPIYQPEYTPVDYQHPFNWKEIEGEYDLFGDGAIVIFQTPGHTAGHQSIRVKCAEKHYILAADAAYVPEKMKARKLAAVLWSPDAVIATWEKLEKMAKDYDADLIFTHDLRFRETVKIAPEYWYV